MTINPADDAPEAPQPSPTLALYMRVVENDAADDYDGGRLVMKPVNGGRDLAILDASLVLSSRTDELLMRYPWKGRAAKQSRFYKLTVEEIDIAELPPDPAEEAEIKALEARLDALKAEGR